MPKKPTEYIEYEDGTRVELSEDDSPEWTAEDFKQARPFKDAFPELYQSWKKQRGRPKLEHPKKEVKLRIDADVLESFKATGKGWHTRMNNALAEWARQHGML